MLVVDFLNARNPLIILLACTLLIAMPSQATESWEDCSPADDEDPDGSSNGTTNETNSTSNGTGPSGDNASEDPSATNGSDGPSGDNASEEPDATEPEGEDSGLMVCEAEALAAQVCTLVSITNHGEVIIDPDGCIWPIVDRVVNGREGAEVPSTGTEDISTVI